MSEVTHHGDVEDNLRRAFTIIGKYRAQFKEEALSHLSRLDVRPFGPPKEVPKTIAIDGSYAPIYHVASMWLIAARAAALHYEFFEDTEGPEYQAQRCDINECVEVITTSKRVARDLSGLSQELTERIAVRRSEAPKRMAALVRVHNEWQLANFVAKVQEDSVIIMDGTLTTPPIPHIDNLANDTVEICNSQKNTLVGLSKDSSANLFGSLATDEELLSGINRRELLYVKTPEPERTHLGPRGDIFFVKLHPDAPKWFRVDVATSSYNPMELFGVLSQFSRNQLCLGYPIPLAEAHMLAVQLRKYPALYDELLVKIGQDAGLDLEEIIWGRTNVDGRRMDAFHAYLDLMARR